MSGLAPPHSPSTSSRIAMVTTSSLMDRRLELWSHSQPLSQRTPQPVARAGGPTTVPHGPGLQGATPELCPDWGRGGGACVLLPSHSKPRLSAWVSPAAVTAAPQTPPANSSSTNGPGPLGSTGTASSTRLDADSKQTRESGKANTADPPPGPAPRVGRALRDLIPTRVT